MTYTALHRAAGVSPGPLTNELLDEVIAAGARECRDLDFKKKLPAQKSLKEGDFPKDVAAMANVGGGVIVFGVAEAEKIATTRCNPGRVDENFERSIQQAVMNSISPPVIGVTVHIIDHSENPAIVVEVPASADGPHMVYKGGYFGAPLRTDADTHWMRESEIETMYRARFAERRHASEALDKLFDEEASRSGTDRRAWTVCVAHPRIPRLGQRFTRDEVRQIMIRSAALGQSYSGNRGGHPLDIADLHNPRPGLRRWVAPSIEVGEPPYWNSAWASVHHDGSITVSACVGGHKLNSKEYLDPWQADSAAIERTVADFMALIRTTGDAAHIDEYELRIAIVQSATQPLSIVTRDDFGNIWDETSTPLPRYTPVEATVSASVPDSEFHRHLYDLACDVVNQGGISNLRAINRPPKEVDS